MAREYFPLKRRSFLSKVEYFPRLVYLNYLVFRKYKRPLRAWYWSIRFAFLIFNRY